MQKKKLKCHAIADLKYIAFQSVYYWNKSDIFRLSGLR